MFAAALLIPMEQLDRVIVVQRQVSRAVFDNCGDFLQPLLEGAKPSLPLLGWILRNILPNDDE